VSCCGPRVPVHTARSLTGKVSPSPKALMRLGSLSRTAKDRPSAPDFAVRNRNTDIGSTESAKKSECPVAVWCSCGPCFTLNKPPDVSVWSREEARRQASAPDQRCRQAAEQRHVGQADGPDGSEGQATFGSRGREERSQQ
jgi:hypothetical protein